MITDQDNTQVSYIITGHSLTHMHSILPNIKRSVSLANVPLTAENIITPT